MQRKVRVFHFVSYVGFRLGEAWVRLLPIQFLFVVGRIGGGLAYVMLRRRRAIALRNLRLAFGEKMSESELRALARRHFELLGANLLAGLKAATLSDEQLWSRVTANEPKRPGESGCIILTSHIGNWELYSHLARKYPEYRFGAVYQPLANPLINRYLTTARTKAGLKLFDRRKQLLGCMRFLRSGGVVGVLADQGAGYAGVWTPLFGRLTSSSTLAARMSVSTRLPIVPIAITTSGCARWKMTILDPIYPGDEQADVFTAKLNRVLEEQICRSPADWLWAHNRWKPLRPHFLFAREQRRVSFPPDFDHTTLDPFRILIVSPATKEEALTSFPAVRAIKLGRPDNSVTVLAPDGLVDTWKTNQAVDHVLEYNESESLFGIAAKIRGTTRFDVSIFLVANWRLSLAFWIAGIPLRVGPRSGINWWLCNQHPAEPAESLDPAAMNLHIAQSVGADINAVRS